MKKKYRITYSNSRLENKHKHRDVTAETMEDATKMGYHFPEASSNEYTDFTVEEIPEGPTTIGICFKYYDEVSKKTYSNYMCILANSEAQAVEYYNKNIKGRHFYQPWPHKIDENGNCVYKDVDDTYFISSASYHFDALNS